jgi:hypothetical protein
MSRLNLEPVITEPPGIITLGVLFLTLVLGINLLIVGIQSVAYAISSHHMRYPTATTATATTTTTGNI